MKEKIYINNHNIFFMIDIHLIRTNYKVVKEDLEKRKDKQRISILNSLIKKDKEWRKLKSEIDSLRKQRNELSLKINKLKKQKKPINKVLKEVKNIPNKIKKLEEKENKLKKIINQDLLRLPNLLHSSVPYGKDENDNKLVRKGGKPKKHSFKILNHAELGEKLGILDFDKSAEVSGHGFYYLKGNLALLNQALIRFAIDFMIKKDYTYIEPPLMLRQKPYEGVTDLEKFENVLYKAKTI